MHAARLPSSMPRTARGWYRTPLVGRFRCSSAPPSVRRSPDLSPSGVTQTVAKAAAPVTQTTNVVKGVAAVVTPVAPKPAPPAANKGSAPVTQPVQAITKVAPSAAAPVTQSVKAEPAQSRQRLPQPPSPCRARSPQ